MGILNKLKTQKEFTPQERVSAMNKELNEISKKYHCVLDVKQTLIIAPLEIKDEVDNAKEKDK